jgi:hypothetical protein
MWRAWSSNMEVMLTDSLFWPMPTKNQLGNSRDEWPGRVRIPSRSSRTATVGFSDDVEIDSAPRGDADLETGRVDDAIDLVLESVGNYTVFGDAIHSPPFAGIDQRDTGPVEDRQALVVEGWSLAELAVPGLERFRNSGVARTNTIEGSRTR